MVRLEEFPRGWHDARAWAVLLGGHVVGSIECRNGWYHWYIEVSQYPDVIPYGSGIGLYDCSNQIERQLGVLY